MEECQEKLEVTQDGMQEGWKARWKEWKRKEEKMTRLPLFPSLLRRGFGVGRPVQRRPWRTAWTLDPCKCFVAATAPPGSQCGRRDMWWAAPGWDSASLPPLGWLRRDGEGSLWALTVYGGKSRQPGGCELTVRRGEDVVSGVQAQHWHLYRFQPVARTGIVVVVIIGGVAEHDGGEALIKFPDGLCLQAEREKTLKVAA